MLIGELARRVGISRDSVRFYERAGLIPRAGRRDNEYRDYSETDVEHLRLLTELRRLDLPLVEAARIAGWCHSGHCAETTRELPAVIADRRADVAERIGRLRALDERLARLERHLERPARSLTVLSEGAACCQAVETVSDLGQPAEGCACCGAAVASVARPEAG